MSADVSIIFPTVSCTNVFHSPTIILFAVGELLTILNLKLMKLESLCLQGKNNAISNK